jgi:hypothetical protein
MTSSRRPPQSEGNRLGARSEWRDVGEMKSMESPRRPLSRAACLSWRQGRRTVPLRGDHPRTARFWHRLPAAIPNPSRPSKGHFSASFSPTQRAANFARGGQARENVVLALLWEEGEARRPRASSPSGRTMRAIQIADNRRCLGGRGLEEIFAFHSPVSAALDRHRSLIMDRLSSDTDRSLFARPRAGSCYTEPCRKGPREPSSRRAPSDCGASNHAIYLRFHARLQRDHRGSCRSNAGFQADGLQDDFSASPDRGRGLLYASYHNLTLEAATRWRGDL